MRRFLLIPFCTFSLILAEFSQTPAADILPPSGNLPFSDVHFQDIPNEDPIHLTQYRSPQYQPAPEQYFPDPYLMDEAGLMGETGDFWGDDLAATGNVRPGILPDYFDIFHGLDASKQPQDFGVNGLYGGRFSVNATWILDDISGIGWQLGTSVNYSENGLPITEQFTGSSRRIQNFSTFGLFQHADNGITWGAAFDLLYQDYYDEFLLGQWRANLGFSLTQNDDFGVWMAIPQFSDRGNFGSIPVKLTPIQQVNFYWRKFWKSGVVTTNWIGWAQEHNDANLLYGDQDSNGPHFVHGSEFHAPLNDHLAIYGQGNFIRPVDSGAINAYVGLVFYLGGGAFDAPYRRNAPVHSVANNPMFTLDLSR